MLTQLKAVLLALVGIPVMVALLVGAPFVWWDARQNFGLHRMDNLGFGITAGLCAIAVGVSARAYGRFIVKGEGSSAFPRFVTRVFPLQVAIGIGLGVFGAHRIHEQRWQGHSHFATRYCAEVLCPVSEGEILFEDDCAPAQEGTACFEASWGCQRTNARVDFEARERAVLSCIRAALSSAAERGRGRP